MCVENKVSKKSSWPPYLIGGDCRSRPRQGAQHSNTRQRKQLRVEGANIPSASFNAWPWNKNTDLQKRKIISVMCKVQRELLCRVIFSFQPVFLGLSPMKDGVWRSLRHKRPTVFPSAYYSYLTYASFNLILNPLNMRRSLPNSVNTSGWMKNFVQCKNDKLQLLQSARYWPLTSGEQKVSYFHLH